MLPYVCGSKQHFYEHWCQGGSGDKVDLCGSCLWHDVPSTSIKNKGVLWQGDCSGEALNWEPEAQRASSRQLQRPLCRWASRCVVKCNGPLYLILSPPPPLPIPLLQAWLCHTLLRWLTWGLEASPSFCWGGRAAYTSCSTRSFSSSVGSTSFSVRSTGGPYLHIIGDGRRLVSWAKHRIIAYHDIIVMVGQILW